MRAPRDPGRVVVAYLGLNHSALEQVEADLAKDRPNPDGVTDGSLILTLTSASSVHDTSADADRVGTGDLVVPFRCDFEGRASVDVGSAERVITATVMQ